MSGHKRCAITISDDTYRRLKKLENKLSAVVQNPIESFQPDAAVLHDWCSGLTHRLQDVEPEAAPLAELQDRLEQEIAENRRLSMLDTVNFVQHAAGALDDRFSAIENALGQGIQEITDRLLEYDTEQERGRQAAEHWLDASSQLLDYIYNNLELSPLQPHEWDDINHRLDQAYQNLDNRFYQAALLQGQEVYRQAQSTRLRLEYWQAERDLFLEITLETIEKIYQIGQSKRYCPAVDLNGENLDYLIDVDYWTDGAFSIWLNKIESLINELRAGALERTNEQLGFMITQELPELSQQVAEIVLHAHKATLRSQLRINLADEAVDVLTRQGFTIRADGYSRGDFRRVYKVRLDRPDGAAMEVQVAPAPESDTQNVLHLFSLDAAQRTHHELVQRSREVNRALAWRGLRVGEVQTLTNRSHHIADNTQHYLLRKNQTRKVNKKPVKVGVVASDD